MNKKTDLKVNPEGLGHMAHDGVNELALVVPLLAGLNIFLRHPALAEIDVALLLVDPEDHDGLDAADLDEAADGPDPAARELGEEDHALDVVVLEQGNVGAHVGDGLDLYHHRHVHLRVLGLVHAALKVRGVSRHGGEACLLLRGRTVLFRIPEVGF